MYAVTFFFSFIDSICFRYMKLENRSKELPGAKSDLVDAAAHDRIHVVGNLTPPRVMIRYSISQISPNFYSTRAVFS